MESTSPRLIQSWQAPRLKSHAWADLLRQWQAHLAIAGSSFVLACACLAELLNPNTAGLGVAAASWGFLTLAHWSRNSAAPAWRGLLVLAPFLVLATLYVSGLGSDSPRYEEVKRIGSLSGLIALGTALHLTITRRSTLRKLLVIACALSIIDVGLVSMVQFVNASAEVGLIERFLGEPHLTALSLLALCLAIGLLGQRKNLQASRRVWLAFSCLPLMLPLALSLSGWSLVGSILLIIICKRFTASVWRHARWLMPIAATTMILVSVGRTWWQAPPELWQAYWEDPLLGTGATMNQALALPPGGWMIALREYSVLGLLLLFTTPFLYLKPMSSTHTSKPQALRDWCWIGCGLMAVLAVWSNPFDHHGVAVFTVILFVAGQCCHRNVNPSKRKDEAPLSRPSTATDTSRLIPVLRRDKTQNTELPEIRIRPNLVNQVIYSATGPKEDLVTAAKPRKEDGPDADPENTLPISLYQKSKPSRPELNPKIWRRRHRHKHKLSRRSRR